MIYYASTDSAHFSYQAIGRTLLEANEQMRLTLIAHALNYDLDVYEFLERMEDSVRIDKLEFGKGYIDGFEDDLSNAKKWCQQ